VPECKGRLAGPAELEEISSESKVFAIKSHGNTTERRLAMFYIQQLKPHVNPEARRAEATNTPGRHSNKFSETLAVAFRRGRARSLLKPQEFLQLFRQISRWSHTLRLEQVLIRQDRSLHDEPNRLRRRALLGVEKHLSHVWALHNSLVAGRRSQVDGRRSPVDGRRLPVAGVL